MAQSELDVINSMLIQIGESAVNTVDLSHPDVRSARRIIDDVNIEIQSKEWWYNTEEWELTPQADGEVLLPGNAAAIITDDINWIKRGRKLYDLERHSFDFSDEDSVTLRVISYWDLEELPPTMYTYLVARCKKRMQVGFDFNDAKVAELETEITRAFHYVQVQHLAFTQPNSTQQGTAQLALSKIQRMRSIV